MPVRRDNQAVPMFRHTKTTHSRVRHLPNLHSEGVNKMDVDLALAILCHQSRISNHQALQRPDTVPPTGLEPARLASEDSKSSGSTDSPTAALSLVHPTGFEPAAVLRPRDFKSLVSPLDYGCLVLFAVVAQRICTVMAVGLEPTTNGLKARCSTN